MYSSMSMQENIKFRQDKLYAFNAMQENIKIKWHQLHVNLCSCGNCMSEYQDQTGNANYTICLISIAYSLDGICTVSYVKGLCDDKCRGYSMHDRVLENTKIKWHQLHHVACNAGEYQDQTGQAYAFNATLGYQDQQSDIMYSM